MHDASGVRCTQTTRGIRDDPKGDFRSDFEFAFEFVPDRFAVEQLHHEERIANIGFANIVDLNDVSMNDASTSARFSKETSAGIFGRFDATNELEGDFSFSELIDGSPHDSHAALAKKANEFILAPDFQAGLHLVDARSDVERLRAQSSGA
jgi:hypothetical protein